MKTNHRFHRWLVLPIFLMALGWSEPSTAAIISSVQSGDWENTATWSCGCVPGSGDTITISNGTTVKVNSTQHAGSLTVNGTFDMNNQFFEFEGATFTNNGSIISTTGGYGQIDFIGVGGTAGTSQTIAGSAGSFTGGGSFPVLIVIGNGTTTTSASGTVLSGLSNLVVQSGCTLSLPNPLAFANGALTSVSGGMITGAGRLQTQGTVTLSFGGTTTPLLEVVNGTTTAAGNFGAVTIDHGATLFQSGTCSPGGNVIVVAGGTWDMNNGFLEFEGTTFTNNGLIMSTTGGFGQIDFVGIGNAAGTTQTIAGTGPYAGGASFPVVMVIGNGTIATAAIGAVTDGLGYLTIQDGCTLSLPHPFVFSDGAINSAAGSMITGAGPLKTQGAVTLNFAGSTAPALEVVNGTTTTIGTFGAITIDSSAKLFLSGTSYANGNLTVASGSTLDMNNQFLEFQGTTLTNNGSFISSSGGFGEIDWHGVNAVGGTTQNLAGTGSYDTNGRNDMHVFDNVTVIVASDTDLTGLAYYTFDVGTTFDFTGSGSMTLAGGVTNSGTVMLNGGTTVCGDTSRILIRSSVNGVQRTWNGTGVYVLTDVDFKDQAGSSAITVTGGLDSGNNGANWTIAPCPAPPSLLLNISTRLKVLTDENVLIGGFIVTGTQPKKVILRAIGPSLGTANPPVAGALGDPILELHKPDGSVISNDNWRDTQETEIIASTVPPTNNLESAIVATLDPGAYTAVVSGKNGATGIGLVEAYDLDQSADSQLANISTRGFVDTGANVMIGGFIVGGNGTGSTSVIVRAIGPSLGTGNPPVPGALADTILELHDGNGVTIFSNDNWRDTQESEIMASTIPPTNDLESAIVATLTPGAYTAIVSGKNNKTGVALVEAYNLQ